MTPVIHYSVKCQLFYRFDTCRDLYELLGSSEVDSGRLLKHSRNMRGPNPNPQTAACMTALYKFHYLLTYLLTCDGV